MIKPTTTSVVSLNVATPSGVTSHLSMASLEDDQYYASRTNGSGAFSADTAKLALIALLVSHIDTGPYPGGSLGV